MSETTNLKLFKHDEPLNENTNQFNVKKALNENWDKVDDFAKQVNDKVVEKVEGKGLSQEDFTTEFKTKLENLNNYDDTEVKQDIANIKQEQTEQNTNITKNTADIEGLDLNKASKEELQEATLALRAELLATKKDLQASSLEGQAEGESLYLQDSSNARFREFGIGGNSKQEKREEINLYNKNANATSKGVDANGEEYVASGWALTDYISISAENKLLKYSGLTAVGNKPHSAFYNKDKEFISSFKQAAGGNTVEIPATACYVRFTIEIASGDVNTFNVSYPAMPSLKFPSEVKTAKDSANATVCNKSFFDKNAVIWERGKRINANTGELEDNSYEWSSTQNYISVPSNSELHFKGTVCYASWRFYIHTYDANKRFLKTMEINSGNEWREKTFNTEEAKYVRLTFNPAKIDFDSIQLEEGSTATDVVEHKEQTFTIDVQQEMLEGDIFEKVNGVWKEKHNWKKIVLDGTENCIATTDSPNRFLFDKIHNFNPINHTRQKCTHSALNKVWGTTDGSFDVRDNRGAYINIPNTTAEELKAKLAEDYADGTPLTFYFEVEPYYLDCTEAQIAVLNKIEQLHSYKGGTHVYSVDAISPIFNAKYTKDTEAYIQAEIEKIAKGVINNV